MIQQNTPTNELIEVIQEKSHEFTVGFPFNTRVTTLNHSVWFSMISVWFRVILGWFRVIQGDSVWFHRREIWNHHMWVIPQKGNLESHCSVISQKGNLESHCSVISQKGNLESHWNQLKSLEIKWNHSEINWNHTDSAHSHMWWFRVNHCINI